MAERMKWIEVIMPQLAESLVSATIGKWLKKPGDRVEQYEPICEVITDKVNAEIPSTVEGIMGDLLVEEGTTIAVGEAICRMQVAASDEEMAEQVTQAPQQNNGHHGHVQQGTSNASDTGAVSTVGHDPNQPMRNRYSPAVQSLAAEYGLNLQSIQGSGAGWAFTRKDVLAFVAQGGNAAGSSASAQASSVAGQNTPVGVPSASPFSGVNRGNGELGLTTGETVPAADAGVPVSIPVFI